MSDRPDNKGKRASNALRFRAYQEIKEKIIYLELRPGEKISESLIAKSLNTSRTPVREALLMLQHEKLVLCNDSVGFIVRRFSAKEIDEYFALRKAIEYFVIDLVVEKITKPEIADLNANVAKAMKMINEGNDIRNVVRCESEFHELLYRAAKSDVLYDTISSLVDKFQWFRALSLSAPGAANSSLSHHREMIKLINRKSVTEFKMIMHTHLDESRALLTGARGLLL